MLRKGEKIMSENVTKFPDKEAQNSPEVLKASFDAITEAMPELQGMEGIATLLTLPDEQFNILAPQILIELEKSLNNVNDKLILVQALNVGGMKSEDLLESFGEIAEQIDEKMTTISNPKKNFIKTILGMLCNAIADTEGVAKRIIQIPIELIHQDAKVPEYAHATDAGMDIYALDDYTIKPGETKLIPTGIKVAIPLGYELQVRAKSGIALKTKMRLGNSVGTIDSGYRDEVGIIIENVEAPIQDITYEFDDNGEIHITSILHGKDMHITKGQKIAQLVLSEVPKVAFFKVEDISKIENDGRKGGFGSSSIYSKDDERYGTDLEQPKD